MSLENLKILMNKAPEEILKHFDIIKPPVDIKDLIRNKLNITIDERLEWDKLFLDGYVQIENDSPRIWLNDGVSEARQNFTLAHELGHIVNDILPNSEKYQDPIEDNFDTLYRKGVSPIERRANDFAARLLMPAAFIDEEVERLSKSEDFKDISLETVIKRLSARFRVSYDAMKWRLVNLGYINKDKI
ncbi:ImmA/IrrE family metallo-endopeptidase [Helicobacter sp. 11S03491-1]|uniref:ImmA/IrrE family metallo-endopeptidase n=1 Tax=Helicobacter sp. 11S03491-1 TaxID=1476196 RepID=UPI000BA52D59|nr:ImmA/IrrE family metallo-endopeptidase [Helicobacter sp. 11S03491-1]PAF41801.1 hypothetical protein BKH45_05675 [Helicobacter sp. 11S03491-1]